ncbi:PEP/pyruvate-binding domain-containing protein [Actinocrispum sp. NPDC049592]|uniref:PEP/pyruvate-binding domain-containing protein n=1 Tax=Actinocrispum sp. NPDC049592 TaxID=3154835 RepID=UPI00343842D1
MIPLARAYDVEVAGGKAARLGTLIRLGVPVPPGYVVVGDYDDSALAGYPAHQRFAVRSSASVEDSRQASFAGQFQSILDVERAAVPAAVAQVRQSLSSASAATYARRLGADLPTRLAVVVQEQVRPLRSGVCFTINPVTAAAELVIEYVDGLGDRLVSGQVDPLATVHLSRTTPDHGELGEVARLALEVERLLGDGPQDIEWAIDPAGVWILQSRPITTLATPGKDAR